MIKKLLAILIIISASISLSAQQLYQVSLPREHNFILNPAMTGADNLVYVTASYRKQWTQIESSPVTFGLSGHTRFDEKNIGAGAYMFNDKTGPTAMTSLGGTFAYHIPIGNKVYHSSWHKPMQLSFGISLNINQYRLNRALVELQDPNDAAVLSGQGAKIAPEAAIGIYYHAEKLWAGVSVPQLIGFDVKLERSGDISTIKRVQHFYGVVGGKIPFQNDKLWLEPEAWLKYVVNAPFQADMGMRLHYKDVGWLGAQYRTANQLVLTAGVDVKSLRIGYAYDLMFTDYRAEAGSSHEIFISYRFEPDFGY